MDNLDEVIETRKGSLSSEDVFSLKSYKTGESVVSDDAKDFIRQLEASEDRPILQREMERLSFTTDYDEKADIALTGSLIENYDNIRNKEGIKESGSIRSGIESGRITSTQMRNDVFTGRPSFLQEELQYLEEEAHYKTASTPKKNTKPLNKNPVIKKEPKRCIPCMDGFMEAILSLLDKNEEQSEEDPEHGTSCDDLPKTPKKIEPDRFANLSENQMKALRYLKEKKVEEVFHYFITFLLWQVPGDPITYLSRLCEKCIQFREGHGDPPMIFDVGEQATVYRGLDPSDAGVITYQQYCNGMKTMFLENYNTEPRRLQNGLIEKATFLKEADKCALANFVDLICTCKDTTESMKDQLKVRKLKSSSSLSENSSSSNSFSENPSSSEHKHGLLKSGSKELNVINYQVEDNEYYEASTNTSAIFEEFGANLISEDLIDSQAQFIADIVADVQHETKKSLDTVEGE